MLRRLIPKQRRRNLLVKFVKHRYWYLQGSNSLNVTDDMIPIEKITIFIAGWTYIISGAWREARWVIIGGAIFFVCRIFVKWFTGYFWHNSDGYEVETEWNKGKVPPGRAEVVNGDALALMIARYLRMDRKDLEKCWEEGGMPDPFQYPRREEKEDA